MSVQLEKDVERIVLTWCDDHKILHIKLNLMARRGWPDRLLILPSGVILWLEFKRPGKDARELQKYVHRQLRERYQNVYVVDNAPDAISYIKANLESTRIPEKRHQDDAATGLRGIISRSRPR
jgi:hypothetical protein